MPTVSLYLSKEGYARYAQWIDAWRIKLEDPDATEGEILTGLANDKKMWPPGSRA